MVFEVGVIGAGAAGLCAARHFSKDPFFSVTVFEQSGDLGGQWKYHPQIGKDENGIRIHTSMYENLRTNLPKEVMQFPDYQFHDCQGKSFIHHSEVQKYLENYAKSFQLTRYIKFYRKAVKITIIEKAESTIKWLVDIFNYETSSSEKYSFDGIVLCIGQYTYPLVPKIPGLDTFTGRIIHSHDYRNNKAYHGLNVLLIGGGPSGIDISVEVAQIAKSVVFSHASAGSILKEQKPENLTEEPRCIGFQSNIAQFDNGSTFEVDEIILCTGYDIDFSLLDPKAGIKVSGTVVTHLYRHLICSFQPTLAILGICRLIIPLPFFHQCILALIRVWKKEVDLPDLDVMLREEEEDFKMRLELGWAPRKAHNMDGILQWNYLDSLAAWAGIEREPPLIRKMFAFVHQQRKLFPVTYKDMVLKA